MFERYTEKARRTIFFARYEASQLGSAYIESEHILLGLLREDWSLLQRLLPNLSTASLREQLTSRLPRGASIPTSVDLPLSKEGKNILSHAAEEADRLADSNIGTEHLLLGLLREPETYSAQLLTQNGAKLAELRQSISKLPERASAYRPYVRSHIQRSYSGKDAIEIHGTLRNIDEIRVAVRRLRENAWHWKKQPWIASDLAVERKGGAISFDLGLSGDAGFELLKGGWTKDYCTICRWELFESIDDPSHGIGYTNGRDWLCSECHEKFFSQDFFSPSYPEMS
jgi:ATP-dependent Clp protease ATP-binding subunit ClpA